MATSFKASDRLEEAVRGFEGLRLAAYQDSAGVWTIGYGHTGEVWRGMRIDRAQADEYLAHDLAVAGRGVNALGVCGTQGQFDALCDFVFNLGMGRLRSSTLLKKIRAGRPAAEVQAEFRRWVYAGKKRLPGLVRRREWEARRWAGQ